MLLNFINFLFISAFSGARDIWCIWSNFCSMEGPAFYGEWMPSLCVCEARVSVANRGGFCIRARLMGRQRRARACATNTNQGKGTARPGRYWRSVEDRESKVSEAKPAKLDALLFLRFIHPQVSFFVLRLSYSSAPVSANPRSYPHPYQASASGLQATTRGRTQLWRKVALKFVFWDAGYFCISLRLFSYSSRWNLRHQNILNLHLPKIPP